MDISSILAALTAWLSANLTTLGPWAVIVLGVLKLLERKLPAKLQKIVGYDVDADDLRAAKQLEERGLRRKCPVLQEKVAGVQQAFFNKAKPKPPVTE